MANAPLLDGPKARKILGLAFPVILAMLTQTGVNIVDTYFIGKLPSDVASAGQAALTPSLMFLWAIGGFLSSIGVGTQATTARRFGEGDNTAAGAVLPNAILVALIGGVLGTAAGYAVVPLFFSKLSTNPSVIDLGTTYTRWRLVGITSMAATAAYKAFFDGTGRTHLHLVAAVAMNVVNAALCWLLIFGHWGFPQMGVAGAGVGACISTWIGLAVMAMFSFERKTRTRFQFYRQGVLSWRLIKSLLSLSIPGGIATMAVMTGFLIFIKVVARLDGATTSVNGAATTIIIEVLSATFVSCLAFGTATATLVGQSLGQGDPDLAERYAWTSVKLGAMIFAAIGLVMVALPAQVLGVFTKQPAVVAAGTTPMQIMGGMGAVVATAMILTQALFGAGETKFVMVTELTLHFGCLVPVAWLFGITFNWGLVGVWLAAGLYALLLAMLMAWRFRSGSWKTLKV